MNQIAIIPAPYRGQRTLPAFLSPEAVREAWDFHRAHPEYSETPLVGLPALAKLLGVGEIWIKDESKRFGLGAFKGLGASYAVHKLLKAHQESGVKAPAVFVTATDGNHGRAVAWAASRAGCRAFVLMPKGSRRCRADAIRAFGAKVEITEYGYDDTVRMADAFAKEHGYHLVQDTGFEGYEQTPNLITQGYTTMAEEALCQLERLGRPVPTHLFLQAGVGSMAAGVLGYLAHRLGPRLPVTAILEAEEAACIYQSAIAGQPVPAAKNATTLMAGLNCGEVNPYAWPVLRDFASFFVSCPDLVTIAGMRALAHPNPGDPAVESGESGAVGLGLLLALCTEPSLGEYKRAMGLSDSSSVLLFNTEGATDPENYREIISD